jgi:hypothetical protein
MVRGEADVPAAHEDRSTHVEGNVVPPNTGAATPGYVVLLDDQHPDSSVGKHGGSGQTADPGSHNHHVVTIPYDSISE